MLGQFRRRWANNEKALGELIIALEIPTLCNCVWLFNSRPHRKYYLRYSLILSYIYSFYAYKPYKTEIREICFVNTIDILNPPSQRR